MVAFVSENLIFAQDVLKCCFLNLKIKSLQNERASRSKYIVHIVRGEYWPLVLYLFSCFGNLSE